MNTIYFRAYLGLLFALGLVSTGNGAGFIEVYGGPTYDSGKGYGYLHPLQLRQQVTESGTAIGSVVKYDAAVAEGRRAVQWGQSMAAIELAQLGLDTRGAPYSEIKAINNAGMMVGAANKFVDGISQKIRAVRWDASGTVVTELDHIAESINPVSHLGFATAINDSGLAVGWSSKTGPTGSLGKRAVRWEPGGTAVTELGHIGTRRDSTRSEARVVNEEGVIAGYAEKYSDEIGIGIRAVRWDVGSIAAVELGHLGTDSRGFTDSFVTDINTAGTIVGWAKKSDGGVLRLERPVRWDAGGTIATELTTLSEISVHARGFASSVNDQGTSVGWSTKHIGFASKGTRAVRWDASTTTPIELEDLGTDSNGRTSSTAYKINGFGVAVGYAEEYELGERVGDRAVVWGTDASAIDLNTLIDPESGWLLERAFDISDSGWITGVGQFDPGGGEALYERLFLLRLPTIPIPEPATVQMLALAVVVVWLRGRSSASKCR